MVVAICFEAPDGVVLLKLEVVDESGEQFSLERHLLEPREETGLTRL